MNHPLARAMAGTHNIRLKTKRLKKENYCKSLVKKHWPVSAIKVLRNANDISLKEAADIVHDWQAKFGISK